MHCDACVCRGLCPRDCVPQEGGEFGVGCSFHGWFLCWLFLCLRREKQRFCSFSGKRIFSLQFPLFSRGAAAARQSWPAAHPQASGQAVRAFAAVVELAPGAAKRRILNPPSAEIKRQDVFQQLQVVGRIQPPLTDHFDAISGVGNRPFDPGEFHVQVARNALLS